MTFIYAGICIFQQDTKKVNIGKHQMIIHKFIEK